MGGGAKVSIREHLERSFSRQERRGRAQFQVDQKKTSEEGEEVDEEGSCKRFPFENFNWSDEAEEGEGAISQANTEGPEGDAVTVTKGASTTKRPA